jgi:AraC-like DNA-binding protein
MDSRMNAPAAVLNGRVYCHPGNTARVVAEMAHLVEAVRPALLPILISVGAVRAGTRPARWLATMIATAQPQQFRSQVMARRLRISRRTLSRAFRDDGAIQPKEALRLLRVVWAALVYQRGNVSYTATTHALGYDDPSALSHTMAKTLGFRPGTLRGEEDNAAPILTAARAFVAQCHGENAPRRILTCREALANLLAAIEPHLGTCDCHAAYTDAVIALTTRAGAP